MIFIHSQHFLKVSELAMSFPSDRLTISDSILLPAFHTVFSGQRGNLADINFIPTAV